MNYIVRVNSNWSDRPIKAWIIGVIQAENPVRLRELLRDYGLARGEYKEYDGPMMFTALIDNEEDPSERRFWGEGFMVDMEEPLEDIAYSEGGWTPIERRKGEG